MIPRIQSVYVLVGGDKFFKDLVDNFYAKIDEDDLLRYMFPQSLDKAKQWNYLFLRKIFGGPDDYVSQRGHPRMRKRHLPFKIGIKERNRWLSLMLEALDDLGITEEHEARSIMQKYFDFMATKMINQSVKPDDF